MMRSADCSKELGNDETSVATGDEQRTKAGYKTITALKLKIK
jgi:hypothetical protein